MKVEVFDYSELCLDLAKRTDGMSGREIAKLGVAWQADAYSSESGLLTQEMVLTRANAIIQQHQQKVFNYYILLTMGYFMGGRGGSFLGAPPKKLGFFGAPPTFGMKKPILGVFNQKRPSTPKTLK